MQGEKGERLACHINDQESKDQQDRIVNHIVIHTHTNGLFRVSPVGRATDREAREQAGVCTVWSVVLGLALRGLRSELFEDPERFHKEGKID